MTKSSGKSRAVHRRADLDTATNGKIVWRSAGLRHGVFLFEFAQCRRAGGRRSDGSVKMRAASPQGGFKIGARKALAARCWHQIKFARTRLFAFLVPHFLFED